MIAARTCIVRKMADFDLDSVLTWRNSADVRRFMLTQHIISADEHRAWFARAKANPTHHALIAEEDGKPVGVVTFADAEAESISEWGFYTCPGAPRGTGTLVCSTALEYAFSVVRVHKVSARVLDINVASQRLHQRLHFQTEGRLREQHRIDNRLHDVVCFGLLAKEWQKNAHATGQVP